MMNNPIINTVTPLELIQKIETDLKTAGITLQEFYNRDYYPWEASSIEQQSALEALEENLWLLFGPLGSYTEWDDR